MFFTSTQISQHCEGINPCKVCVAPKKLNSILSNNQIVFCMEVSRNRSGVEKGPVTPFLNALSTRAIDTQVLGFINTLMSIRP